MNTIMFMKVVLVHCVTEVQEGKMQKGTKERVTCRVGIQYANRELPM